MTVNRIPDYIRILSETHDGPPTDVDALLARVRPARERVALRARISASLRRWRVTARVAPGAGAGTGTGTPILRDYPWRSLDRP